MKKLIRFITVCTLMVFSASASAEELGLKVSNLSLYKAPAAEDAGSSGGIEKGLIQLDISLIMGGHGPVAGKGFDNGGRLFGLRIRPGAMINLDFAVHPYVSIGPYFGINGGDNTIGLGIGGRGVFHIYQLIADKANTKVSPGNLDFYFPFHMGTIIGINNGNTGAGFAVGGGLGVRYYFNDLVGIMTEVGWLEMSVWKFGLALKF